MDDLISAEVGEAVCQFRSVDYRSQPWASGNSMSEWVAVYMW